MGLGFRIPAIAMFVFVLSFVNGYTLYVKVKPEGSPFKRLLQVLVAAFKKRKEFVPEDVGLLYQNKDHDAADDDQVLDGLLVLVDAYNTFESALLAAKQTLADTQAGTRRVVAASVRAAGSSSAGVRRVSVPRFGTTFPGTRIAASRHSSASVMQATALQ